MQKYLIADFDSENELTDFYSDEANVRFAREPVLAIMPDGSLVCTFLTGGKTEPHNGNVIVIKKSRDGGKSWSDSEIVLKHNHYGLWSTEIFTDCENPYMVVSMYNANFPFKAIQTFISYTYDNGDSWQTPVCAEPARFNTSIRKGIRLSNRDILFPLYYTMPYECFNWDKSNFYGKGWWDGCYHECSVAISTDNGFNFERYGRINKDKKGLWEPACVEVEEGHIIMFIREDKTGFMGRCDSFDYGRTWGEYALTDIPNPGSKVAVEKINGKVIMVSNFAPEKRDHLQLWLSDDNCKTFVKKLSLDDDDAFLCYPHTAVDYENKLLYVAYENYHQHYLNVYSFEELGL